MTTELSNIEIKQKLNELKCLISDALGGTVQFICADDKRAYTVGLTQHLGYELFLFDPFQLKTYVDIFNAGGSELFFNFLDNYKRTIVSLDPMPEDIKFGIIKSYLRLLSETVGTVQQFKIKTIIAKNQ